MNTILTIYKEAYSYTKRNLRLVFMWFLAGSGLGLVTFFFVPDLLEKILDIFKDKFGDDPGLNIDLAMGIFLNNVQASAIALVGGLILGAGPFLVVISNGFILGYVATSVTLLAEGNSFASLGIILVAILPHGIIEIPAFLIAAALGLNLGVDWLRKENAGRRGEVFKSNLKRVLWAIPVVVIMLFIAALIEVYITPPLIDWVAK